MFSVESPEIRSVEVADVRAMAGGCPTTSSWRASAWPVSAWGKTAPPIWEPISQQRHRRRPVAATPMAKILGALDPSGDSPSLAEPFRSRLARQLVFLAFRHEGAQQLVVKRVLNSPICLCARLMIVISNVVVSGLMPSPPAMAGKVKAESRCQSM